MRTIKQIFAVFAMSACSSMMAQTTADFNPYQSSSLRLPSVPLFVNDPYFSLWSPFDRLNDGTTRHWCDAEKSMDGILRVDGKSYRFMGSQRKNLLKAIAPMATAESGWTAKVTHTRQNGTAWTSLSYDDSGWTTEEAAWGTREEYPNCRNDWRQQNSDIYIRRVVSLTADDLQKDLWIQFSHDDVFELYINGHRIISTGETWLQGEQHHLTTKEKGYLKEGDNMIAAHCHNTTGGAYVDFGLFENILQGVNDGEKAVQKSVDVMATSTYYSFDCGPVELKLVFTAPMIIDDLDLISTPINYLSYQVTSTDSQLHDVQFYFATSAQLTVDQMSQPTRSEIITENGLRYIKAGSVEQPILKRAGDLITIDWGYLYLPAVNGEVGIADAAMMEGHFRETGQLLSTEDAITSSDAASMPTLAYMKDFGNVTDARSYMMIGYDEVKDIRYMNKDYCGYWARNGKTIFQAFDDMRDQYRTIMDRCRQMDQQIYDDGLAAGNVKYAELLAGCYRHVLAAHKLFQDDKGQLLYFSKENNSNGCVNTVDLTYPSAPLFLCYNTQLQKGMIRSILDYCANTTRWGFKDFACHDLGTYPHANGQVYSITRPDANGGFGGNMPIEESGNILTLCYAISRIDGNADWLSNSDMNMLRQWAIYLRDNGQDPDTQLCTDDFAGHWAHNANLSLKAIFGVAAYAELARMKGQSETRWKPFADKARQMAQIWEIDARDGDHYKLAFDRGGTWSIKYNLIWDKLWGLDLFTKDVMRREIKYYLTKQNTYGLPLDSREAYTKSDWVMWAAAMAADNETFLSFSDRVWKYANETPTRWPLSDWYWTNGDGAARGFRARSVIGGHWMKVLMDKYSAQPGDEVQSWQPQGGRIKTRWVADINPEMPLPEYPRPQMMRQQWKNLNGLWQYAVTGRSQRTAPTIWDGQILVPFPLESSLSGVMRMLDKNDYLWYQRQIDIPESWHGQDVLLHFGAVDYQTRVYVNGTQAGSHIGGFGSFSFNITDLLHTDGTPDTLTVLVIDNTDEATQPLGKQRYNPGGAGSIWYTQVSGIWQTVWLEPVAHHHISNIQSTPDVDNSQLRLDVEFSDFPSDAKVKALLKLQGSTVAERESSISSPIIFDVPNARLWSPVEPTLYELEVMLIDNSGNVIDHVDSYTAMRKISTQMSENGEWRLQLNNKDLFQFGPLDQGYWPDGLYTAPTDEALLYDIQKTKDWGYNMIRKHMKVESARWYYHCDRLGLLVWQDMPALGRSDEPWRSREWSTTNGQQPTSIADAFKNQWKEIIKQHYSNPCIVVWTPFNESWGQFQTAAIVDFTREQDSTRLINPASGGNHFANVGDFLDLHDYDRPPHIFLYDPQRPVVLGEYGGLGRHIDGHRWYENQATTYVNYSNENQLTDAYVANTDAVIAMAQNAATTDGRPAAFCAAVYTQTTDVETEVNGIMTYDREVIKMDEERLRQENQRLVNIYGEWKPDESAIQENEVLRSCGQQRFYTLSGIRSDRLCTGVNIVRKENGEVYKILIR